MSLTLQNLFTNSCPRLAIHFPPKVSILSRQFTTSLHFQSQSYTPQRLCALTCSNIRRRTRLQAYESDATIHGNDVVGGGFNFDSFLSIAELVCLVSSVAAVSVRFVACLCSKNAVLMEMGNRVSVWGLVLLAGGVAIGAWIRRRQWRRVCRQTVKGGLEVNLLERIEKLEEDLRSSATIIRVLSRQLEKLGIRFRVTRKSLKEPIAETVALARKNSEATRALAVQEDILEKELGEIQKMLLAMQEQQQKQLELILAISKNGKLWESKREQDREQDATEIVNSTEVGLKQKETHQI